MRCTVMTIRLTTIGVMITLALGLLAVSLPADAQKPGKVYRIGFLMVSAPAGGARSSILVQQARAASSQRAI